MSTPINYLKSVRTIYVQEFTSGSNYGYVPTHPNMLPVTF